MLDEAASPEAVHVSSVICDNSTCLYSTAVWLPGVWKCPRCLVVPSHRPPMEPGNACRCLSGTCSDAFAEKFRIPAHIDKATWPVSGRHKLVLSRSTGAGPVP